jgi:predicted RNA-binding protein with PUA-like domain
MAYFLAKTDPDTYSIDDLKREGKTTWDGVRNPTAVNFIKTMKPGDTVIVYHTGDEKAIVGLAKVISAARPDPKDDRSWVADFEFVKDAKKRVTLKEIKDSHQFDDWALVRQGRLSTMSAPDAFWKWLQKQGAF